MSRPAPSPPVAEPVTPGAHDVSWRTRCKDPVDGARLAAVGSTEGDGLGHEARRPALQFLRLTGLAPIVTLLVDVEEADARGA